MNEELRQTLKIYTPTLLTGAGITSMIASCRVNTMRYKELAKIAKVMNDGNFKYKIRRKFASNNWLKMHHIPMRTKYERRP